jgi:hypothetical protein
MLIGRIPRSLIFAAAAVTHSHVRLEKNRRYRATKNASLRDGSITRILSGLVWPRSKFQTPPSLVREMYVNLLFAN